MNDAELLENFVKERAETAFRALVKGNLPLVIGLARYFAGSTNPVTLGTFTRENL